jgi:PAS domain-containing protein
MVLEAVTASLALALGGVGLWARRLIARATRADAALLALAEAAPIGLLRVAGQDIRLNPAASALLGLDSAAASDRAGVLACFTESSADRFAALLVPDGSGPTSNAPVETRSGATLAVARSVAPDGAILLWLSDETALSDLVDRYAAADRKLGEMRAVLDALPVPIWWRGADQSLAGVNRAMAAALETEPADALRQRREFHGDAREIAGRAARLGVAQTESRHVVVRGERLLYEIAETPLEGRPGETAGLALDRTALEEVTRALERHMAGHADVLERLSMAVAIYGPDQRLQFHNQAFRAVWGVGAEDLDDQPGYGQVLELLRERRRLPEIVDFRAFVRAQEALFTSLLEPVEDLLHLPDERTLRVTIAPHPMGGLMFLYQDVTDRLRLERSRNTLAEVQQATLNQLQEGVAVFGTDGRLRLWNPVFARLWRFDPQALDSAPHITDLVDRVRPLMAAQTADAWARLRQSMVLSVTETGVRSGRLERPDGMILDTVAMPLPDGQRLLLFVDVSASVAVERALDERNKPGIRHVHGCPAHVAGRVAAGMVDRHSTGLRRLHPVLELRDRAHPKTLAHR